MSPNAPPDDIARLRARIDALNGELLRLLERRGELTLAAARLKRKHAVEFRDPDREAAMLATIVAQSRGLYEPREIEQLFEMIFAAGRAYAIRALPSPG